MSERTLGKLKKRVLETLGEYIADSDGVVICDGDRELILSRIPDAVSAALRRMYEGLDVARRHSTRLIYKKRLLSYNPKRYDGGEKIHFSSDTERVALYFRYFGEGYVDFFTEKDLPAAILECKENSDENELKCVIDLKGTGNFYAVPAKGVSIYGFTVYAAEDDFPYETLCENSEDCFSLPSDFGELERCECEYGEIDKNLVRICENVAFAPAFSTRGASFINVEYKKKPQVITGETGDELVIDLSPLAFDALVYLVSAELCREGEADLYTRLIYKYNDISVSLMRRYEKGRRNGFYRGRKARRW